MARCQVEMPQQAGQNVTACPHCGGRPTHLRGATGRISLCPRCGWTRTEPREQQTEGATEEAGQGDGR